MDPSHDPQNPRHASTAPSAAPSRTPPWWSAGRWARRLGFPCLVLAAVTAYRAFREDASVWWLAAGALAVLGAYLVRRGHSYDRA